MSELSPAAQAVFDAYLNAPCGKPRQSWVAAVLRAAADQVVPEEPYPEESQFWDDDDEANREWQNNQHFRRQLLSIATELEQNQ